MKSTHRNIARHTEKLAVREFLNNITQEDMERLAGDEVRSLIAEMIKEVRMSRDLNSITIMVDYRDINTGNIYKTLYKLIYKKLTEKAIETSIRMVQRA